MKTKLTCTLAAIFGLLLVAATAPIYTQGPATLWRLQCDPAFDVNGNLTSGTVTSFYQATFTNSGNSSDTFTKSLGSVTIDCVANANLTVTYNGTTYRYGDIAGAAAAMSTQEWNKANPNP